MKKRKRVILSHLSNKARIDYSFIIKKTNNEGTNTDNFNQEQTIKKNPSKDCLALKEKMTYRNS